MGAQLLTLDLSLVLGTGELAACKVWRESKQKRSHASPSPLLRTQELTGSQHWLAQSHLTGLKFYIQKIKEHKNSTD